VILRWNLATITNREDVIHGDWDRLAAHSASEPQPWLNLLLDWLDRLSWRTDETASRWIDRIYREFEQRKNDWFGVTQQYDRLDRTAILQRRIGSVIGQKPYRHLRTLSWLAIGIGAECERKLQKYMSYCVRHWWKITPLWRRLNRRQPELMLIFRRMWWNKLSRLRKVRPLPTALLASIFDELLNEIAMENNATIQNRFLGLCLTLGVGPDEWCEMTWPTLPPEELGYHDWRELMKDDWLLLLYRMNGYLDAFAR
jgi:hypothetical protein